MRYFLMLAIIALPFVVQAADLPASAKEWQKCQTDKECELVKGICGPTAINSAYREEAVRYYTSRQGDAACKKQFWIPPANAVRCRIESCEAVVD